LASSPDRRHGSASTGMLSRLPPVASTSRESAEHPGGLNHSCVCSGKSAQRREQNWANA